MKKAVILLFLLLFLVGCAAPELEERPADELVVALSPACEPAAGFDPIYGWGGGEHVHEPLLQSTLTVTKEDLTVGYDLATGYEVSPDGLVWTVWLREDVRFTDGEALTAEDVVFTYMTAKEAATTTDLTMLEKAEAVDDGTVRFTLREPFSLWPYTMAALGIVPEHACSGAYGGAPIGSGRYVLSQWDKGQQAIFTANPDYYGQAPQMKKVTVLFLEEDTAFLAVQAGAVDVSYTSPIYAEQAVAGYGLSSYPTVDNRGLNLPAAGNPVTEDTALRQALNVGIDRQKLIDDTLSGYGTPAYSVCDGMPWYNGDAAVACDIERAKALLDEAGWAVGADGIRAKDGVRAALTLLYPTGDSLRQALCYGVAEQMASLGIEAAVEGVGWDTAYDRALSTPLMWGWGAHTPMELYHIYHTGDGGSAIYSPYADPAVDEAMDAALRCGDLTASYGLWQQAQETILADCPWLWLVNVDHLYWVREGVQIAPQKLHPHGHGWSILNNVDAWTWK